jgi:pantoate--beta-alanine ligase
MKIITTKKQLAKFVKMEKNLGFVPTMGSIHIGHISLIKKSIKQSDKTIVTIFINKPQFNKKNDFLKYPRMLNKDISSLKKLKVDYLYLPKENQIYQDGPNNCIKISTFEKKLCGKFRPGHFKAVVDVIERFIKIIKPAKIYLGEKDMQQLKIIEHFVNKNYSNIKVVGCKTIREKNGIACSSRNFFLTLNEKKIASKIYKYVKNIKKKLIMNQINLVKIRKNLNKLGVKKIDYIQMLDINKIINGRKKSKKFKIFVAYYLGSTRLIDNI